MQVTFNVLCRGRDHRDKPVFGASDAIPVTVSVRQSPDSNIISTSVTCPHNVGGHGHRCKAAHPEADKIIQMEATCCYSIDLPLPTL